MNMNFWINFFNIFAAENEKKKKKNCLLMQKKEKKRFWKTVFNRIVSQKFITIYLMGLPYQQPG